MVVEAFAGISIFKTMFDTAKSLKDMSDAALRNSVTIELQEQILSAQAAQLSLVEQVGALKAKLADFETWETEKQRYEMKRATKTATVYALKPDSEGSEPPHWLCPNCYQNRKKSILQYVSIGPSGPDHRKAIWGCSACQLQVRISNHISPGTEDENAS